MDDIFYALTELMEAHHARNQARDSYEGHSWGYHGQHYEDAINVARDRFKAAFKEEVLQVIKEAKDT